eukprot:1141979-Pelagomonas_calceolata.AAC.4
MEPHCSRLVIDDPSQVQERSMSSDLKHLIRSESLEPRSAGAPSAHLFWLQHFLNLIPLRFCFQFGMLQAPPFPILTNKSQTSMHEYWTHSPDRRMVMDAIKEGCMLVN